LYSPRSWRVDNADVDVKRSSPILFFCAVMPRSLAAGIGTGRAKQIYCQGVQLLGAQHKVKGRRASAASRLNAGLGGCHVTGLR
jgi:hypothetical protein